MTHPTAAALSVPSARHKSQDRPWKTANYLLYMGKHARKADFSVLLLFLGPYVAFGLGKWRFYLRGISWFQRISPQTMPPSRATAPDLQQEPALVFSPQTMPPSRATAPEYCEQVPAPHVLRPCPRHGQLHPCSSGDANQDQCPQTMPPSRATAPQPLVIDHPDVQSSDHAPVTGNCTS